MSLSKPLVVLPLLLVACTDHALVAPNPMPEEQTDTYVPINTVRKVDILFMIDNSLSMKEEQENLARNFPAFIDELRNIEGGLPDVHIGVVTSDLGSGASPACPAGGQNGLFQGWDKACGLDRESRFIVASNGEHDRNYQGDLAAVFGCMAQVGIRGCGYEHQLAATAKALSVQRTPENAGFLRDDAYLQIVLITDEDDCSAAANSTLFSEEFPGEEASFRCARAGHVCQGKAPPAADFSAPLAECQPVDGGALTRVQEFVDQIRALKGDPNKVLVSGIFGWPTSGPGTYQVGREIDMKTNLMKGWDYLPTCTSGNGSATAALRVKQFVDAFGANGAFASICAGDFRPVLESIGEKLAGVVGADAFCIGAPLVDTSPVAGLQLDCLVSESVPARGGYDETLLPACKPGSTRPCWRVAEKVPASCSTGVAVEIDRKGQPVPAEALVSVKCRTCVRADDPRCQR